ncbi:DUF3080 family protein [Rheinheimera sp. WS51]|uniref:DUF3080 family protein n=1 Tax=Rheinheimera sp. WS51 TaxID=3425886 RepID=UPI003D91D440
MKALLLPLLLISLVACSDNSGEAALKDYQQRLNRVLKQQHKPISLAPVEPLVAVRDLKRSPSDIRINLSDAYATRQCGLDQLIGERNSSLGRLYSPSKLLNYELRLLTALENCLQHTWQDSQLESSLQQAYNEKQADIHNAWQNMLQTDSTIRKELLGSSKTLALQAAGFTETWQALSQLQQLKTHIDNKNWSQASAINIEQQLQLLYQYNFIGRLQYSLRVSSQQLAQLNSLVQANTAPSLCPNQRETEQLTILANVFQKYYLAKVQVYLGQLDQFQQQLAPLLTSLYKQSQLYPMIEQRFITSHTTMRQQLKDHVTWWQHLSRTCPIQLQGAAN